MDLCSVAECGASAKKSGRCERHYRQARRRGEVGWDGSPCRQDGCTGVALSRGLCGSHYREALASEKGACAIEGCGRLVMSRGWCQKHYSAANRYGDPLAWKKPKKEACTVDECERPRVGQGLCDLHYRRQRRYGSTDVPPKPVSVEPTPFRCRQCGETLPKLKHGKRSFCSAECREAWEYWERKRTHRERWLKKYGITVDQYDVMLAQQGGCCAICRSDDARGRQGSTYFVVDHCHDTGRVRGLLCVPCNSGIGLLQDDVDVMRRAITYLAADSA